MQDVIVLHILGYERFRPLGIRLAGANVALSNPAQEVGKKIEDVLSEGLGIGPIRYKPKNIPPAIRSKIDTAVDKLLEEGVIEPLLNRRWTTPVVPIIQPSCDMRLCSDYKVTQNKTMANHTSQKGEIACEKREMCVWCNWNWIFRLQSQCKGAPSF